MMKTTFAAAAGAVALAAGLMISAAPAHALTMQECSAKYNAAKTANSLGGASWNDFRKAQCGEDAPAAAPAPAAKAQPAAPAARGAAPVAAAKNVVFPRSVDRKYSAETPAKANMHTCLDQYKANKANGGNGELKWIMKGGGYYSQCNNLLKKQQGA